jgi:hypothetical protein
MERMAHADTRSAPRPDADAADIADGDLAQRRAGDALVQHHAVHADAHVVHDCARERA